MLRTYRYRMYPTQEQQAALNEIIDMARWLYNHALAYRRKRWYESRIGVTYNEQSAMWRDWRNECPDDNPLRLLNMSAGQQILRRLDKAYREFLKGKRGRPRFKGRHYFNSLNYKPGDGAGLKDGKLYVQNVGLVTVKWHRQMPDGKLKNIIIKRKPSGWYVLLQVEWPNVAIQPSDKPLVGIDVGILHALALSDGTVIDAPGFLRESLKKLRVLQRAVARRKKGSRRRAKALHQLATYSEHIANQRRDWWHKVVHWLVNTYGGIALEDLNLTFMLRNGHLSRSTHDVALGLFYEILDYKAIEAGVEIAVVNPRHTSQMCSGCGVMVKKGLHVRVHRCPDCGLTVDRDVNAAINILQRTLG
ncbi:MAG: IS200/IS605 family element transposase accessory protein TnpB [Chloroflexi bacterium]|nr:IS200/IS605 family element transposase accessory protein TnpB [Chloroflexota bacterium]